MTRHGVVYKITNKFNGKVYIGQTRWTAARRWQWHNYPNSCTALWRAIQKWGATAFTVEEIYTAFDSNELNRVESLMIQNFSSIAPRGYNLYPGGRAGPAVSNMLGKRHSEASKLKSQLSNIKAKNARAVFCVTLSQTFPSVNAAARTLRLNPGAISECVRGKRNHCGNHQFRYAV